MESKWINRLLLMPATLWFAADAGAAAPGRRGLLLRRTGGGRRLCAGLHLRSVPEPPGPLHRLQEHLAAGPGGYAGGVDGRLSPGLLPGRQGEPEVAHPAAGHGDRALLDLDPDPHLRLDLPAQRPWHSQPAGNDRHRGRAPHQHTDRGSDRHRLRLPAAHGLSDLRQPGKTRQGSAGGLRRPRLAALAQLSFK